MNYQPGTHLIASLYTAEADLLQNAQGFQILVDGLIKTYQLQKLGEVYHAFPNSGFTAVVCLSESHLSVHSWPEYGKINIDIYLSNYLRRNDGTVRELYHTIRDYFKATVEAEQFIIR
jgi:S-adenosylmethionine decarboxylase